MEGVLFCSMCGCRLTGAISPASNETTLFTQDADTSTESNELAPPTQERASLGFRFLAFMVDYLLILFIVMMPFLLLSLRGGNFDSMLAFIIVILIFVGMFTHIIKDILNGQSPGKFIFGTAVRMQSDTIGKPSVGRLLLRNVFGFLWFIDFFILVSGGAKIGDRLAKTEVYHLSQKPKIWKRIAVAIAIPVSIVLITVVGSFGTNTRTPLYAEEFTYRMEQAGFIVEDITYRYPDSDRLVSYLIVGTAVFHMEFVVFNTDSQARQAFNSNRARIETASRGGWSSRTSVDLPNSNRFTINFDGTHVVISRVHNTFLTVIADGGYRAEVGEILRMLGY